MNFNLKKYLMLSIAGLVVCNMQSNAMNYDYNDYYNYAKNLKYYSGEKILSNSESQPLVNFIQAKQLLSVDRINSLIVKTCYKEENREHFRNLIGVRDITNYNISSIVQQFVQSIKSGSNYKIDLHGNALSGNTDLRNVFSSLKFNLNPQVKEAVDNILLLVDVIGVLKQNNINFQDRFANDSFIVLANLLYSIKDYDEFKEELLYGLLNNLADNSKDCCLGAIFETIINTQSIYTNAGGIQSLISRFGILFNDNLEKVFSVTTNNKANCLLSSFEKYVDSASNVKENYLEIIQKCGLNIEDTINWLNSIEFKGKVNYEGIINVASWFSLLKEEDLQQYGEFLKQIHGIKNLSVIETFLFQAVRNKMQQNQNNAQVSESLAAKDQKIQALELEVQKLRQMNEEAENKAKEQAYLAKQKEAENKAKEQAYLAKQKEAEENTAKLAQLQEQLKNQKPEQPNGNEDKGLEIPGLDLQKNLKVVGLSSSAEKPSGITVITTNDLTLKNISSKITQAGKIAIDMTIDKNSAMTSSSSRSEFWQALIKLRNSSKDATLKNSINYITRSKESGKYLILEVA